MAARRSKKQVPDGDRVGQTNRFLKLPFVAPRDERQIAANMRQLEQWGNNLPVGGGGKVRFDMGSYEGGPVPPPDTSGSWRVLEDEGPMIGPGVLWVDAYISTIGGPANGHLYVGAMFIGKGDMLYAVGPEVTDSRTTNLAQSTIVLPFQMPLNLRAHYSPLYIPPDDPDQQTGTPVRLDVGWAALSIDPRFADLHLHFD